MAEAVENRCEQERLGRQLNKLSGREKWVLEMRFGMPGGPKTTQRDIAKLLGISRSYVSRIEKRATKTANIGGSQLKTPINFCIFIAFSNNIQSHFYNGSSFLIESNGADDFTGLNIVGRYFLLGMNYGRLCGCNLSV